MRIGRTGLLVVTAMLAAGLVHAKTNVRKPEGPPQPPKEKLSAFGVVEMAHITIAQEFRDAKANQKAAKKIDEVLWTNMKYIYPELKEVSKGAESTATAPEAGGAAPRTLLIEPHIEQIKFIGGGARFMVGAMAGNSAVLMKVVFKDKATGEVIAEPEFFRNAGAWAGAGTVGGADNAMLEQVAKDVCDYVRYNK